MLECRCLVLYVAQLEHQVRRLRDLIFTRRKRRVLDGERKRNVEAELQIALWVGATSNVSGFGRVESWALSKIDLDGTITTLVENSDVHFWAAVPSPDGHRLALNGAKADISNVWLLEHF
jgi:hypothetical protein